MCDQDYDSCAAQCELFLHAKCPVWLSPQEAHTKWDSAYEPSICIRKYMVRLLSETRCDSSVMYVTVSLAAAYWPDPSPKTLHRWIFVVFVVVHKFMVDDALTIPEYAKAGGISCKELRMLERHFLRVINWKVWAEYNKSPQVWAEYHHMVAKT